MYKNLSLLSKSPKFSVCFVFKRFCLTFKVVHGHESISYVIMHLLLVVFVVCMFSVLVVLFICMFVLDTL